MKNMMSNAFFTVYSVQDEDPIFHDMLWPSGLPEPQPSGMIRGFHPFHGTQYAEPPQCSYHHAGNTNRLEVWEFIVDNVFWMVVGMIWYRNLLFRCLENQSVNASKCLLWLLVAGCTLTGMILTASRRRNGISVFCNVVPGYGIYAIITYLRIRPVLIRNVLILTSTAIGIFLMVWLLVLLMRFRIRRRSCRFRPVSAIRCIHGLACTGLALLMAVSGGFRLFNPSLLMNRVPASGTKMESHTIAGSMDQLSPLYDGRWEILSVQEKLNVLQAAADIERSFLGLPHELNVGTDNLETDLAGYYRDAYHDIIISMDCLLNHSSWDLLDTVCHEAYHAYQHRLIDVYLDAAPESRNLKVFRPIQTYANEFASYNDGKEDLRAYYIQRCEADARDYASDAIRDYYTKIQYHFQSEP